MRTGFRFDPPRLELEPEVRWLLARAFGPAGLAPIGDGRLDLGRVGDLGAAFDLLSRIAARAPAQSLERELGPAAAEEVRQRFLATAARAVQAEGLCRQVAEVARGLGLPVVLLKGMALQVQGIAPPGSRASCDVDVLVEADGAERLQQALLAAGFRDTGFPAGEHQLAPLLHPAGVVLEVHTMVWGVRLAGEGRSATAGELIAAGLCRPVERLDAGCLAPNREVLVGHVLVHAIAQHGLTPAAYPMTRALADLQDLGLDREGWQELVRGPFRWIASEVSLEEAAAAAALVGRLGSGDDPAGIAGEASPEALLLRHVVAGVLDAGYREALRLRALASPQIEGSLLAALLRDAVKAVWLADAQIDVVYGRPRTRAGYWGRRLWRPFDLVARAARYARAWTRYRWSR